MNEFCISFFISKFKMNGNAKIGFSVSFYSNSYCFEQFSSFQFTFICHLMCDSFETNVPNVKTNRIYRVYFEFIQHTF